MSRQFPIMPAREVLETGTEPAISSSGGGRRLIHQDTRAIAQHQDAKIDVVCGNIACAIKAYRQVPEVRALGPQPNTQQTKPKPTSADSRPIANNDHATSRRRAGDRPPPSPTFRIFARKKNEAPPPSPKTGPRRDRTQRSWNGTRRGPRKTRRERSAAPLAENRAPWGQRAAAKLEPAAGAARAAGARKG